MSTPVEIPARFIAEGFLTFTRTGDWLYQGSPITNPKMQQFLARHLVLNQDGTYWVENGPQRVVVDVEDAAFLVTRFELAEDATATMTLNDGSQEKLTGELLIDTDNVIYTTVKPGMAGARTDAAHLARFTRNAANQLGAYVVETDQGYGAQWDNTLVPITER